MRNTGKLFANDANADRAKAVVGNLHRLGITNCVVSNYDGRVYPKVKNDSLQGCHVSYTFTVIGLGPRDVRFHTLNWKHAHYFQDKCANFASIIIGWLTNDNFA